MNERTLRIATYNIHGGWGMDKVLDLPRIADVIKTMDVDFIVGNRMLFDDSAPFSTSKKSEVCITLCC